MSSFPAMGTVLSLQCNGGSADLARRAEALVEEVEQACSRFRPESEVSQLCHIPRGISEHTRAVLEVARWARSVTAGWLDITGGIRDGGVLLDDHAAWLSERTPVGAVDLGALAKGYAADLVRDLAVKDRAEGVLVNLGGSSIAVGESAMKVGLPGPWRGLAEFGVLTLEPAMSMSMSADPPSTITLGKQRSHVRNPHTGTNAFTDLCAVAVIGPNGLMCEALSTAFLAMGCDEALQLAVQLPDYRAVFFTLDGRVLARPGLELRAAPGAQDWLARRRVLAMRKVFRTYSESLGAIGAVLTKPVG